MKKIVVHGLLFGCLTTTVFATDNLISTPQPTPPLPTAPTPTKLDATQTKTNAIIDCHYRIPAKTTEINPSVISDWAKKAATQAFDLSPTEIDKQLVELKACFTETGWASFNDALTKSGNLTTIKTQLLTVSSSIEGDVNLTTVQKNQWKAQLAMQVLYQNAKEKLIQYNKVDLLIGRKTNGDLGIMQIIVASKPLPTAEAGVENKK